MNITIVGGGFAGVRSALLLAKQKRHQITLITTREYFQFNATMYEVATGGAHEQAWIPLGQIFDGVENVQIILDRIQSIDKKKQILVSVDGKEYKYENLILSMGSTTTYFGIKGMEENSFGIKTYNEIATLKKHLYEMAEKNKRFGERIAIIGGGPTGVELAAVFPEYLEHLAKRFNLPKQDTKVVLIEAAPRLTPMTTPHSSKILKRRVEKFGVEVYLETPVSSVTKKGIEIPNTLRCIPPNISEENAKKIDLSPTKILPTETVIWTSGVANNPFFKENGFKLAKNGKVEIDEYLQSEGIYILGDNAATPYSGLAQVALSDAEYVAKDILARDKGQERPRYEPKLPIMIMPVGKNWALMEYKKFRGHGWHIGIIRKVAELGLYMKLLPFKRAVVRWYSQSQKEEDYF